MNPREFKMKRKIFIKNEFLTGTQHFLMTALTNRLRKPDIVEDVTWR